MIGSQFEFWNKLYTLGGLSRDVIKTSWSVVAFSKHLTEPFPADSKWFKIDVFVTIATGVLWNDAVSGINLTLFKYSIKVCIRIEELLLKLKLIDRLDPATATWRRNIVIHCLSSRVNSDLKHVWGCNELNIAKVISWLELLTFFLRTKESNELLITYDWFYNKCWALILKMQDSSVMTETWDLKLLFWRFLLIIAAISFSGTSKLSFVVIISGIPWEV